MGGRGKRPSCSGANSIAQQSMSKAETKRQMSAEPCPDRSRRNLEVVTQVIAQRPNDYPN